jgi:arylsulfatase A-like enzyme
VGVAAAAASLTLGLLAGFSIACSGPDSRPSVVLIVADTLRADAVSAYGAVEGTTPHLDALAAEGLRYTQVYSPSPWTIPSHASLFTGQGIDRHRVGMHGRLSLPEEFVTLAERFQEAGYETAAFSENMLVGDVFQLLQGFRYRRVTSLVKKGVEGLPLDVLWTVEPALHIPEWLESRPAGQPFFLFVNLFDPHSPYTVRDENPWVPADSTLDEMGRHAEKPERLLCGAAPSRRELDILRGLYLGEVAETDRKIEKILDDVQRLGGASKVISVVTADHGELFGDRKLLGHEFNLRQGALHVPLIVNGVDVPPAVLDDAVTLVDIAVSIIQWAGLEADPSMDGRPLPVSVASKRPEARPVLSAYSDDFEIDPEDWAGVILPFDKDISRASCGSDDKVFGGMASIIDYPFKYQWFELYPPELYDLSWDPEEKSDQSLHQPDVATRLASRLEGFLDAAWLTSAPSEPVDGVGPAEAEALKALGYID